jgi:hypothetical protein
MISQSSPSEVSSTVCMAALKDVGDYQSNYVGDYYRGGGRSGDEEQRKKRFGGLSWLTLKFSWLRGEWKRRNLQEN